LFALLIISVCFLLNGIFSSFEMAYITIGPDRLNDLIKQHKRLQILTLWKKRPERILSTIQIGITFVGGLAAVVGGAQLASGLRDFLITDYDLQPSLAKLTSIFVIILPLTYLNVVFGELLPKAIALHNPEKVLIRVQPVMVFIEKIFSPLISIMERSTRFFLGVLHLTRSSPSGENSQKIDIKNLEAFHRQYVLDLVAMKGKRNQDILVPWQEVVTLDFNSSQKEVMEKITDSLHTRLPVVKEGQVVGLLNTKEYTALSKNKDIPWQSMIRLILNFYPEQNVLDSFKEMQLTQNQMAWISTEGDRPLGMITMENILEEFLGSIYDEDDDDRLRTLIEKKRGLSRV
jgi:putative hemolysin